ncbi:hypothetical protein TSOC_002765, partial [Tetrabaena socialis]
AGPRVRRSAGGYISWDIGVDLTLHIAGLLTAEHSPFFDDSDLARVAAACACAGNGFMTGIAEAIWQFLSPRYGEELDVRESSDAKQMKAVLKSWGRTQGGTKAELWKRIQDEVVGEHAEDEDEGGKERAAHCPVARGVKRRIREQQVARVSKTKAKDVYGLCKYQLEGVPTVEVLQPSFGPIQTYAVKDLKLIALRTYKNYRELQASQQRNKDWMTNYTNTQDSRRERVVAVLAGRGVCAEDAKRATEHFWHLPYFSDFRPGEGGAEAGPSAEWLSTGAEAAANQAQAWLFHLTRTNYRNHYVMLLENHQFAKPSKYK